MSDEEQALAKFEAPIYDEVRGKVAVKLIQELAVWLADIMKRPPPVGNEGYIIDYVKQLIHQAWTHDGGEQPGVMALMEACETITFEAPESPRTALLVEIDPYNSELRVTVNGAEIYSSGCGEAISGMNAHTLITKALQAHIMDLQTMVPPEPPPQSDTPPEGFRDLEFAIRVPSELADRVKDGSVTSRSLRDFMTFRTKEPSE